LLSLGFSRNRSGTVVPKEILEEGKFYHFLRLMLALIVRVFALFHIVGSHPETTMVDSPLPLAKELEPISGNNPAEEAFSVDHISPIIGAFRG
jgi:hypothetical protein